MVLQGSIELLEKIAKFPFVFDDFIRFHPFEEDYFFHRDPHEDIFNLVIREESQRVGNILWSLLYQ